MELSKKTTILFPPKLHEHLVAVARRRGVSVGHLVRAACEAQYGSFTEEERLQALEELVSLSLPVGPPRRMVAESVPPPEDLLA